ncbi:MAG: hypothetical protein KDJ37_17705 [Hyphomicrobiaceae bacterium]|nr:hypothetical protein [Hyphomicrobiaceae bacterium]
MARLGPTLTGASHRTALAASARRVACGLAALALVSLPAAGADLSGNFGDCCADLEERIAELEASTARRGNRPLALTVSGHINEALLAWHDGEDTDVYVVTNAHSTDRFRFAGRARFSSNLSAGFRIELGLGLPSTAGVDQFSDDRSFGSLSVRYALWYVSSRRLGSVTVGQAPPATDDIIAYNLGHTNVAGAADTALLGGNLFTRDATVAGNAGLNSLSSGNTISLRWRRFVPGLDTGPANIVRYDSPILHGFALSASWGEDDQWDVALRFARDFGRIRIAGGIGYLENREEEAFTFGWPSGGDGDPAVSTGDTIVRDVKGSASILDEHTGLFAAAAYVHRSYAGSDLGVSNFACFASPDAAAIRAAGIACANRPDLDYVYVQAGLRRKFMPVGKTAFFAEYAQARDGITGLNVAVSSAVGGDLDFVTDSRMEIWGLGVVQRIDAAAMELYASWRHFSADVSGIEASGVRRIAPIEDAHVFLAGSRIRF